MTRLMLSALILLPAGASACDSAAGACASGQGCGVLSLALLAAVAALGVWVLRAAVNEGGAVKRACQAVGWTLAVVGLGGFLCGAVSYGAKRLARSCSVTSRASGMELPPGHPPLVPGK